jgi:hypothetical protein
VAEQKRFALYEYLIFFWKKKQFFIIIPLIFALLGFGASYLVPKKADYVGSGTVFTGSVKLKALTNPSNIMATFGEGIEGDIEADVTSESYVKIKIYNDDKAQLESDLAKMTGDLEKALLDSYEYRKQTTEKYVQLNTDRLDKLNKVLDAYMNKSSDTPFEEKNDTDSVVEWTESEIADVVATINRVEGDLAFFEPPSIVRQDVNVVDTHKMELTLAGLILGIVAAILFLMLWKYMNEARRYYNHD